ncbi:hypothetical protein KWH01_05245 [Xanthomonas campestris pv. merremiae]|uniref:hypothetical protein n=1 Tax=Xanthomonas citri TaxID=346 RepID=UPI000B5D077C|nr:hypothetical protein [Xanthomonas citri]ASK95806.1 hypothetical protein XcvCFBP7112P_05585 [Xanthomonas citri pv. vignicola]MBV6836697.1 hypothetical protein [Xanthomonas campestris pv. merremiae]MBZ3934349.1 hypothetical protein [Xanthomonas campestris pv. merremiae]MCC8567214.1 hypothetical protein [Xanthomonas citri pv. fuscans]
MADGWFGLGGALIGAFSAGGIGWLVERAREGRQERALSIAVASEAAAIAEVVRARDWMSIFHDAQQAAAQRSQVYAVSIRLPASTLTVSRAAQQQAGQLSGTLPRLVPRLVLLADAIEADIRWLFENPLGTLHCPVDTTDPKHAAGFYGEDVHLIHQVLQTCDGIVQNVRETFPKQASAIQQSAVSPTEQALFP